MQCIRCGGPPLAGVTPLQATDCYTQALLAADNLGLEPSHYLRLSTGLNYTVFLYDVMNNDKKAVEVSKQ